MESLVMVSTRKKINYTKMEKDLIELLPKRGRPISSTQLVDLYYGGKGPFYAQESVSKVMRELIRKVDYNEEKFMIIKTKPRGPHPSEYAKVSR